MISCRLIASSKESSASVVTSVIRPPSAYASDLFLLVSSKFKSTNVSLSLSGSSVILFSVVNSIESSESISFETSFGEVLSSMSLETVSAKP